MYLKYSMVVFSLFFISCDNHAINTSVESNATSVESNATSVESNATSVESNATSVESNTTSVESNATSVESNTTSVESNTTSVESNTTSFLLKTAQLTIYYPNDDGAYQAGTQREYNRTNSTVHEISKNIFWQDSNEVTNNSYTQAEADSYCYYLIQDGYDDWRLPTIYEAMSLIDYGKETPAMDSAFINTGSGYLWTSTACPVCKAKTFAYEEVTGSFLSFTEKDYNFHTRCIRENATYSKELTRDDTREIVIDNNTSLMWQDDISVNKNNKNSFQDAIDYCESLVLADFTDWRLPNIIELRTLLDFSGATGSAHPQEFVNLAINYWSSTTVAGTNGEKAWDTEFYNAISKAQAKELFLNARCVRITQ